MKLKIIERPEYIFYEERFDEKYFIHLDVFKWNKKIRSEILDHIDNIANYYKIIWTRHFKDDVKHKKFLELIRGHYVCEANPFEGRACEYWIRKGY